MKPWSMVGPLQKVFVGVTCTVVSCVPPAGTVRVVSATWTRIASSIAMVDSSAITATLPVLANRMRCRPDEDPFDRAGWSSTV